MDKTVCTKRITPVAFCVSIPKSCAVECSALTSLFIEWLSKHTDVYLRLAPSVSYIEGSENAELCFSAGLAETQNAAGRIINVNTAWVELDARGEIISPAHFVEKGEERNEC